jgi:hypothetical protein
LKDDSINLISCKFGAKTRATNNINHLIQSPMKKFYSVIFYLIALAVYLSAGWPASAEEITYTGNWGSQGMTLERQDQMGVKVNFSITSVFFENDLINGESMQVINLPGVFLPNDEGCPNLPGSSRYIAIPQGAEATVKVLAFRTQTYEGMNVAPAFRIPKDTDNGPLYYEKNMKVYGKDAYYPAEPVRLSRPSKIRGLDVVMLGITPFQYNPVTGELIVYKDIQVEITFTGGNGHYGEDRLRSRWWDPILYDAVLNPEVIPSIDYGKVKPGGKTPDYEYIIICPNDATFISWANTVKNWRLEQGIRTGVLTTTDVGGNTTTAIETYVNNAYNTWTIPPVAVLLIGDYGTSGNTIVSPIWNSYCVSDNIYADVDNDDMPEVVFARMTAQNATHLQTMITKFINYETSPPTAASFYSNPITALGWQTERWFQICSEVVGGFWKYQMGKTPVRINAIYSGTPGTVWSTATNTSTVVNYFGPSGLGYIPATPAELGGWSGGTAAMVNAAINAGAFALQHRDHGAETGWGEPAYNSGNIDGLTNNSGNKLPWVFSINCLTGKYNYSSEVFAEKFHRYTYGGQNAGALGITAASEVSYSFVNDAYVWGMMDNLWPNFMPAYGTTPPSRDVLPAFGNAAGKYFLQQSSWPYNTGDKEVTYNLFHHHGDAFTTVYANVPQYLTVVHNSTLLSGAATFSVTANAGSFIGLTANGEIIGTATGTGSPVAISITPQNPGTVVKVVVTKQDYFRYSANVDVIPPTGPYVTYSSSVLHDTGGNNNGQADYGENITLDMTLQNMGSSTANGVVATLSTADAYVTITDNTQSFGNIAAGASSTQNNAYAFTVANNAPDGHVVSFTVTVTGTADLTWESYFTVTLHAPVLGYDSYAISDPAGNNNGKLDPGETVGLQVTVENSGSSQASSVVGTLVCSDPYITINTNNLSYGNIAGGGSAQQSFSITASASTPAGHLANFTINVSAALGVTGSGDFSIVIGQIPVLIIDLDANNNSGPSMQTAIQNNGVAVSYMTSFPADLNLYASAFVCLGIYANNHVLTSAEGTTLAAYLNNGGRLYMEGGDTWYYDPQTAVHPMFNIDGVADGTSDLTNQLGQTGTFTAGMTFGYGGENSWIDHINPVTPAYSIFKNQSPVYGTGVAYDAGTYKTIGTSHEFGGLTNGSYPSTRDELMKQYLDFFGVLPPPLVPAIAVTPSSLDFGNVVVGSSSTKQFSITNSGTAPLTGNITTPAGYTVSGTDNSLGFTVQPGNTAVFDLTFTPPAIQSYNGNVVITHNASGGTTNLAVTGAGIAGLYMDLKVYLEGPFSTSEMTTYLNTQGFLPLNQPYNAGPWNYLGTESVASIPNTNVVDWILIELRETAGDASTATSSTMIGRQAAFLLKNGQVVSTNGSSLPLFSLTITNNLYVVIWHRNHLAIMSSVPLVLSGGSYSYDFSTGATVVYGGQNGHKSIATGIWGMIAGDGNSDGLVGTTDKVDVWAVQAGYSGYLKGDFDLNGNVDNVDKVEKWSPNSGRGSQVP